MIYRLIVLNGPAKGERITVDPEPMVIGRDENCGIVLPDSEAAAQHAQLEQRGAELFIHDLGSMNKIILNKREVSDCRLKHGDIIELGRTRLLVQAIVQADVQAGQESIPLPVRRGRKRKLAMAASILLLAGVTFAIRQSGREEAAPVVLAPPADGFFVADIPAPAVIPVAIETAAPPPMLDEELRRIREDLAFIQKHLQNVNTSAATLAIVEESAQSVEALRREGEENLDNVDVVMTAARAAMDAKDYAQADALLEHAQIEYPDHLPAYQMRAELLELLDHPARAREQWTVILQRTTETDLYRLAVAERIRLGRSESQRLRSAHDAVRILALDQIRFRESTEYDEMRTVKIQLGYDRALGPIDPQGVRLLVYFFEQDLDTRRIHISKVQPYVEANLSSLHSDARDSFLFSVSYIAPKGYYSRDHNTSRQRYYGCIARLHYFDRLIDEQARPAKLLEPAILEAAGLELHTANNTGGPVIIAPSTY